MKEQLLYYHRDHQGSIIALTDKDGNRVKSFTYDWHYGRIIKHSKTVETDNPYGYTGREIDTPDLYYYRARYYDPTIERFLSEDPIGFGSGDFNWYRYVGDSPVNWVDPWGLRPPANVPPDVDMCENGNIAKNIPWYNVGDYIDLVKSGGRWDYKRFNPKLYENFGNYNFGYTAAAFGFPIEFAKFGAGAYQVYSGTARFDWFSTYFDDPNYQRWIDEGYNDYENNYYHCECSQ